MSVFSQFLIDKIKIVKKDNSYTSPEIRAQVDKDKINVHCEDIPAGIDIEDGDFIDRVLPNDRLERYLVIDAGYKAAWQVFPERYECRVRKSNQVINAPKAHVTYNVSGHNTRIFNHSVDNSSNTVTVGQPGLFAELRNLVQTEIQNNNEQLLILISQMEDEQRKPGFARAYKEFISCAADHLTLLTPFLPALTSLIS